VKSIALERIEKIKGSDGAPPPVWVPTTPSDFKTLEKIRANPYYLACFRIESGENPLAKNTESSARGAFQLTSFIRKAYNIQNWEDITENFNGFLRLTKENMKIFRTKDALVLYSAHYLGATLLRKLQLKEKGGTPILSDDQKIISEEFYAKILPRFERIYRKACKDVENGVK